MTVTKSGSADSESAKKQETLNFGSTLTQVELSENARVVLAKRYLKRDDEGNPLEGPEDLFRRVAGNIAQAEEKFDADPQQVEE